MTPTVAAGLTAVVLITCFALATPALSRPTLPFGVRVPADRAADPAVLAERRVYVRLTLLSAAAAAALCAFFPEIAGIALGVGCALLYHRAHRRLRTAKRSGGWHEGRRQGVTVDTTFRTDPVRLPWAWLTPAAAITLITAVLGWWRYGDLPATLADFLGLGVEPRPRQPTTPLAAFEPVISQAVIVLLFLAMTLLLLRARPDLDAARPAGSARRYRVYLRGMARMSLLGAAGVTFSLLIT
ncbi:hypothetical protein C1J01_25805, partial [Nonomuraea aridisoli]